MTTPPPPTAHLHDHHIICGIGHVGFRVVELLHKLKEPHVVLAREVRPEWADILHKQGTPLLLGDATAEACLLDAGIQRARSILIVTSNDLVNLHIAVDAERLNPGIRRIVRVFDHDIAERIEHEMGIAHVYSPALLTAPVFIAAAQGEEMLRSFSILKSAVDIVRVNIPHQAPSTNGSPFRSGDRLSDFCARNGLIPLHLHQLASPQESLRKMDDNSPSASPPLATHTPDTISTNDPMDKPLNIPGCKPDASIASSMHPPVALKSDPVLQPYDQIVVACTGTTTERLRTSGLFKPPDQADARPSSLHKRSRNSKDRRNASRTSKLKTSWKSLPPFLRMAFLGLLAMLSSSAVVFHYAMHLPWIDSLYFVVSILTTVGFGDYNLHDAPPWLKLYGCFVMLAGAAMVAIVYGIITDFIVSSRVDSALGRRRTQLSNHAVIVGLGDVGTRVAEALKQVGKPVVAIERDSEHEAAPQLVEGIAVIIGDANRQQILDQANIRAAKSIIVTTESDLENLRIAHHAEALNPRLRKVVRIYDSMLASRLVSNLGIDRAVNSAATAAATFVAATLHPETEQGFTLGDRLFLLRWMPPEEIQSRKLVYKSRADLSKQDLAVLLKRRHELETSIALPISQQDTIEPDESLLILEEYDPNSRSLVAPRTVTAP